MPVTLPGVIQLVRIRDLGEARAWVLGQGVEVEAVGYEADDLDDVSLSFFKSSAPSLRIIPLGSESNLHRQCQRPGRQRAKRTDGLRGLPS